MSRQATAAARKAADAAELDAARRAQEAAGISYWRASPAAMAYHLSGGAWQPAPHHRLISQVMVWLWLGIIRRAAISLPPGHGKSLLVSRNTPAWMVEMDPATRVLLASYETTLAVEHGQAARDLILENPEELHTRVKVTAANRWQTEQGGGMWSVGIGGAATGRRARLLLVDDYVKNYREAYSPAVRQGTMDWWRSTARSRLLPRGGAALVGTRWHAEDLIGQATKVNPDEWLIIRLPAIAEQDETIETVLGEQWCARLRAAGVTLPVWWREQGQALWPRIWDPDAGEWAPWFDESEMELIRLESGLLVWSALYQQAPLSTLGETFKPEKWQYIDHVPRNLALVRSWDLAATAGGGDWTAGVLMGRHQKGQTFIIDSRRVQGSPAQVEAFIAATAREDHQRYGRRVKIRFEQEPGAAGVIVKDHYTSEVLPEHPVKFVKSTGNKVLRAMPYAGQQGLERVYIVGAPDGEGGVEDPPWLGSFLSEHSLFPGGENDDQVDAAAGGYAELAVSRRRRGQIAGPTGR